MTTRRRPRVTTRRLMLLVALAAVACPAVRLDDQPGVQLRLGGYRFGVARNDREGRSSRADGSRGSFPWQAGLWSGPQRNVIHGFRWQDGRTVVYLLGSAGRVI